MGPEIQNYVTKNTTRQDQHKRVHYTPRPSSTYTNKLINRNERMMLDTCRPNTAMSTITFLLYERIGWRKLNIQTANIKPKVVYHWLWMKVTCLHHSPKSSTRVKGQSATNTRVNVDPLYLFLDVTHIYKDKTVGGFRWVFRFLMCVLCCTVCVKRFDGLAANHLSLITTTGEVCT